MTPEERATKAVDDAKDEFTFAMLRASPRELGKLSERDFIERHVAAAIREAVAEVSIPQLKPFNANSYRAMAESIDEYKGWAPPTSLLPVMSEERTNKFLDEIIAESDRRKKAATCTACKCNGGTHLTTCPMVQPGDFVWEVPAPVFTLTDGVLSPDPGDEQPPPIDYANRPPRGGYF